MLADAEDALQRGEGQLRAGKGLGAGVGAAGCCTRRTAEVASRAHLRRIREAQKFRRRQNVNQETTRRPVQQRSFTA
eukprot:5242894-Pleurochrysis_carterae.AAC.1